jgi:hypothetical protein
MLTPLIIANATGAKLANVEQTWPHVVAALEAKGINSLFVQIAAAATIGVETRCFLPIRERRASKTRQPELWALQERYWPSGYYGRGLVQTTWKENYRDAGEDMGVDLVANPDKLLEPENAAKALARFFVSHRVAEAAEAQDWERVRIRVNGGRTAMTEFLAMVSIMLREVSNG